MRTVEELEQFFEKHHDIEFLKFDRVSEKLNRRPDLHAFLLLDRLVPGDCDMVSAADHDEIFLEVSPESLAAVATDEQLIDLIRCGVRIDNDGLCMFA